MLVLIQELEEVDDVCFAAGREERSLVKFV